MLIRVIEIHGDLYGNVSGIKQYRTKEEEAV